MTDIKTKRPFHCILLLFYVAHTFGLSGVLPSDSPFAVDVGQHLSLGPSQTTQSGDGSLYNDSKINPNGQSRRSASVSVDVDLNLAEAESVKNHSSELSELFSVRSGNASVDSSSQTHANTLEGTSTKTEPRKPNISDIVSTNYSRPRTGTTPSPSLSTPLVVPSEGGPMQDLSQVSTEARHNLLNGESSAGNRPKFTPMGPEVKDSETMPPTVGLGVGLDLDLPAVNKHPKAHDSHISARKGANLPEKTGTVLNDTTEQFTFNNSEFPFVKGNRTQKITPRKGAEPAKIFPRKGVEDQIANFGSSDLFFSEANSSINASIPISTAITTGRPNQTFLNNPWPTSIYTSNLPGIKKDDAVQNRTNRPIFQNIGGMELTPQARSSTPSVSLESSGHPRPTDVESATPTSNSDTVGDIAVKKSNVSLDVTPPLIGSVNDTLDKVQEDKSGIIASYPPLKKRLKPLKTTDIHALNSSPVPPEHTSGEHDYVVPIVVTILTVPMLVVLALFLYKKGSEFWERRHYRRMDFLIDGMYND